MCVGKTVRTQRPNQATTAHKRPRANMSIPLEEITNLQFSLISLVSVIKGTNNEHPQDEAAVQMSLFKLTLTVIILLVEI